MKKYTVAILVIAVLTLLYGCKKQNDSTKKEDTDIKAETISAEKAKEIMDETQNFTILDVRTQEEYDEGHIENAYLIPDYELSDRAEVELPDKDALILVYCRSGRRSKASAELLASLGYTNVKDFGGIIDWKYEIVK